MTKIKNESFYGNVEYKLLFTNMDTNKIEKYATQLKFRIIEGKGKAIYLIGVSDDGNIIGINPNSVEYHIYNMKAICNKIDSEIEKIEILPVKNRDTKILIIKINGNFDLDKIFIIND